MILQTLTDYYGELCQRGMISRQGWNRVRIQFALEIDEDGNLLSVLPLESLDEKGKPIPRYFELPASVKRSCGINSNFLWDNAKYLLGIDVNAELMLKSYDIDSKESRDAKSQQKRALSCFENAKQLHLSLLSELKSPFAKAICSFFDNWSPEKTTSNKILENYLDGFAKGSNLTFCFCDKTPEGERELSDAWNEHYTCGGNSNYDEEMICLVTGEKSVPEKTHPFIMGVKDAQSSGAALVSFNAMADCSYGREQNYNAPVSKYASFAYTTALNYLIADSEHKKVIGDTTVVYWAQDAEVQYQDVFGCFIEGNSITNVDLKSLMDNLAQGKNVNWNGLELHPDNQFCILGLAPNKSRLSVRFFICNSFGSFAKNFKEHFERLEIVRPNYDKDENLSLWKLVGETTNPNANDKSVSLQLSGDTLRSILTGQRYPATLYQQTMLRLKVERKISRGKAAIIKAYLIRNMDEKLNKEGLTVKLNDETTYQPYVLGRMFSVLESIQQKANPNINVTIKDKYFTSACSTPSTVFPMITSLCEKYTRKLEPANRIYFSNQLLNLTGKINESYPAHLSLYDQGIFQLGYYHQTQKKFEKNNTEKIEEE